MPVAWEQHRRRPASLISDFVSSIPTKHHTFAIMIIDYENIFYSYSPPSTDSRRARPEVIKLFPCSTQLSTKFILRINFKMPTIVGILTFISMIITKFERLKARYFFFYWYFSFYEQFKFHAWLGEHEKSFITMGQVVSYKQKFVHRVLVNHFVSACPGKVLLGYLTILT